MAETSPIGPAPAPATCTSVALQPLADRAMARQHRFFTGNRKMAVFHDDAARDHGVARGERAAPQPCFNRVAQRAGEGNARERPAHQVAHRTRSEDTEFTFTAKTRCRTSRRDL